MLEKILFRRIFAISRQKLDRPKSQISKITRSIFYSLFSMSLKIAFKQKKICPDSSTLKDFMNNYVSANSALVEFYGTPHTGNG